MVGDFGHQMHADLLGHPDDLAISDDYVWVVMPGGEEFQGIVVYDPESEEYELGLLSLISRDLDYAGILPVRIDVFAEKIGEIFNKGPI